MRLHRAAWIGLSFLLPACNGAPPSNQAPDPGAPTGDQQPSATLPFSATPQGDMADLTAAGVAVVGDEADTQARASFVAALKRGDAEAACAVYAANAQLLAPSAEPIHGRQAIEAFWRAGLDAGMSDVQLDAFELRREDGLAYETGTTRFFSSQSRAARSSTGATTS